MTHKRITDILCQNSLFFYVSFVYEKENMVNFRNARLHIGIEYHVFDLLSFKTILLRKYPITYISTHNYEGKVNIYIQSDYARGKMASGQIMNACVNEGMTVLFIKPWKVGATREGVMIEQIGECLVQNKIRATNLKKSENADSTTLTSTTIHAFGHEDLRHMDAHSLAVFIKDAMENGITDFELFAYFAKQEIFRNLANRNVKATYKDGFYYFFDGSNWLKRRNDTFFDHVHRHWLSIFNNVITAHIATFGSENVANIREVYKNITKVTSQKDFRRIALSTCITMLDEKKAIVPVEKGMVAYIPIIPQVIQDINAADEEAKRQAKDKYDDLVGKAMGFALSQPEVPGNWRLIKKIGYQLVNAELALTRSDDVMKIIRDTVATYKPPPVSKLVVSHRQWLRSLDYDD
jgi:hypothetical protein